MKQTFSFPFSYTLNKTGLPIVPVTIGEYAILLIIDTGATYSIIDGSVVNQLGNLIENLNKKSSTMGIDGKTEEGDVYKISFHIEKHMYTQEFITKSLFDALIGFELNSGLQVHGILGTEFLVKNNWVIDFGNLEVYSN